ncbi:MAG: chlorite dismutase family protein [Candidatus Rokubacteria bacterium]|nr:chlorite dismutase family protein [Candidatus Rokubacteria bacterium]
MTVPATGAPGGPAPDPGPTDVHAETRERGAGGRSTDRRLFMQLQAFGDAGDPKALARALEAGGVEAVLYLDVADPRGVGVLAMSEDPAFFVGGWRELLGTAPFAGLSRKAELAMLGRTYASGFEPDLEEWLLHRPRRTVLNPEWPWGIWYPLRRVGAFARLSGPEQGAILREHATLGRAYGEADLAHDIRLACHGLDRHDNDFVIGLVGRELPPLSHLVQAMRKTTQTAEYIERLGPFFVGHALWQSPRRGR